MKETISKHSLRITVVVLSLVLIWTTVRLSQTSPTAQTENLNTIDSLWKENDSLKTELFIERTNATRYQIALDRLMESDSVAAKKFEEALQNIE